MKLITSFLCTVACVMPMQAMVLNLNNDDLENVIKTVWNVYTSSLAKNLDERIKGKDSLEFTAEQLKNYDAAVVATRQNIVDAVMKDVFAKMQSTAFKPALKDNAAAQEPFLRAMLQRVLGTAACELLYKRSENYSIACVILPYTLSFEAMDALTKASDNKDTFLSQLQGIIDSLETLIQEIPKRLKQNQKAEQAWSGANVTFKQLVDKTRADTALVPSLTPLVQQIQGYMVRAYEVPGSLQLLKTIKEYLSYVIKAHQKNAEANRILSRVATLYRTVLVRPPELGWCTCPAAPFEKRIALIVRLVNDVRRTYTPGQPLVYAALAAGMLLQDYLIVQELKANGYSNFDINLIELELGTRDEIEQATEAVEKAKESVDSLPKNPDLNNQQMTAFVVGEMTKLQHAESTLDSLLNHGTAQAAFVRKIGAVTLSLIHKTQIFAGIQVTTWNNAAAYVQFAERDPQFKANIITLVDPGVTGAFPVSSQQEANSFMVTISGKSMVYGTQFYKGGFELYTTTPKDYDLACFEQARTFDEILKCGHAKMQWLADSYVSLKDIVRKATTPQAIIGILDFKQAKELTGTLQFFTPATYATLPALSPIQYNKLKSMNFRYVPRALTQSEEKERKGGAVGVPLAQ